MCATLWLWTQCKRGMALFALVLTALDFCPQTLAQAQSPVFTITDQCAEYSLGITGYCVISNARIMNVYWASSIQSYDTTILAQTMAEGSGTTVASHDAVDEFVAAVINSSYFGGIAGYGVQTVSFVSPSIALGAACLPSSTVVSDLFNNSSDVGTVINCLLQNNPQLTTGAGQLLFNFILPMQSSNSQTGDLAFCQAQPQVPMQMLGGWHDQSSQAYTIIPMACNFSRLRRRKRNYRMKWSKRLPIRIRQDGRIKVITTTKLLTIVNLYLVLKPHLSWNPVTAKSRSTWHGPGPIPREALPTSWVIYRAVPISFRSPPLPPPPQLPPPP